jgi:hypothetical protein
MRPLVLLAGASLLSLPVACDGTVVFEEEGGGDGGAASSKPRRSSAWPTMLERSS